MSDFAWAVIGPGSIAHRFADAVHRLPGTHLAAVLGRDAARADAFANHWERDGAARASVFTNLDAMLCDPRIDAIYISTPHAMHAALAGRCLAAGKPVLCEKPLAVNRAQAQRLVDASRHHRAFLMEAVWTRFLPVYALVHDWLSSGSIGAIRGVQSSFSFNVPFDARTRHFDPAQAGGALLDIGVYNLSMTQWVLQAAQGRCPEPVAIDARARIGPTGVDHNVTATLEFPGGIVSQFHCGFDGHADNGLRIFGEAGVITVPERFWEATVATRRQGDAAQEVVHAPFRINGFEGEIEEAIRCISAGEMESSVISHADTLSTTGWMDRIRHHIGVEYPFEQAG